MDRVTIPVGFLYVMIWNHITMSTFESLVPIFSFGYRKNWISASNYGPHVSKGNRLTTMEWIAEPSVACYSGHRVSTSAKTRETHSGFLPLWMPLWNANEGGLCL